MIKFIRIISLRYFRKKKQSLGGLFNYILNFFSITYTQLLDSFFLGSIGLLFFRFFFRLFFFANPFWYFNFSIYIFFILLELKYSLLNRIKEIFIKIAKVLLGKNYWFQYSSNDRLMFRFMDRQQEPDINITQTSLINKFFQQVFIFFVLIRLYSFAFPIKFFILNFLVTFLLIFNNYLLFASFFSFLIIFSRLYIFSSDNDKNKFFFIINRIEKLNATEYINPSWENAKIASLIVSRTYYARPYYAINMEKEYLNPLLDIDLKNTIYKRLIQITSKLSANDSYLVSHHFRMASHLTYLQTDGEIGHKYVEILQKKARKSPFFGLIAFVPFQPGGLYEKIIWLKNAAKTNFLDFSLPYYKAIAKGHPEIFGFFNGYILRSNETTIKNGNDRTGLGIHPIFDKNSEPSGYGNTKTVTAFKPTGVMQDANSYIQRGKNLMKVTMNDDFIPNIQAWELLLKVTEIPNCKMFLDILSERNAFVLPEAFNCVTTFLNPFASKQQIQEGFEVAIHYLNLMVLSKHNSPRQLADYVFLSDLVETVQQDLNHYYPDLGNKISDVTTSGCTFAQIKIDLMRQINFALKQNPEKPPFNIIKKVIKEFFGDTQYTVVSHISNIHNIAKNLGGEDKKKIIYKEIHDVKPFKQTSTDVVVYKSKMDNTADPFD